jgi:hypothetical protein
MLSTKREVAQGFATTASKGLSKLLQRRWLQLKLAFKPTVQPVDIVAVSLYAFYARNSTEAARTIRVQAPRKA